MSTFRQKVQATTNWVKPDPEDLAEPPKTSFFARFRAARGGADPEGGAPVAPTRPARTKPASNAPSRKGAAAPVTAHRLFPAFAAMWFAGLFGLGSLAISSAALGQLVVMTGLPALVPAAAPPLGFTAHLLVAFLLGIVGGALGLLLGLRLQPRGERPVRAAEPVTPVAEPEADELYKVRARDAHPDAPPRRPLVLTEAFGDPLDAVSAEAEAPLLRRKPAQPAIEPAADTGPWIPEFTPGGPRAVQPLDLAALGLFDKADDSADLPAEPQRAEPKAAPSTGMAPESAIAPPVAAMAEPVPAPAPAPTPAPVLPTLLAATPQWPEGFVAMPTNTPGGSWSPVSGAPLEELGLVQLIERLALSMAAQKAAAEMASLAEQEPIVAEPEFAPGPFSSPQPAPLATDGAVLPDAPPPGSAREAILRRLGATAAAEMPGESQPLPPFLRPEAKPERMPEPSPAPLTEAVQIEAVVSLRPAEAAPAPFAPPAAAKAAPAPASPEAAAPFESDEALRTALATLKRMTARG